MPNVLADIEQAVQAQQTGQRRVRAGQGLVKEFVALADELAVGVVGPHQVALQPVDQNPELVEGQEGGPAENLGDAAQVGREAGIEHAIVEIAVVEGE